MLNKARQLYQQVVSRRKPSNSEIDQTIADGHAIRNFRTTRAAKLMEDWIERQRKGQQEYLQAEIGHLTGLGLLKFFNAFLKYIYIVQENRAYRKLEAYLDSVERNGAKYEAERQRAAERRAASENTNRPK